MCRKSICQSFIAFLQQSKFVQILENISLKAYNTFGIDVKAAHFAEARSLEELTALLSDARWKAMPVMFLGGGSNVLFTRDFAGLLIKNSIKGIHPIAEDDHYVFLKAYSGEIWHELVLHAIEQNLGGIENLSLIPGTVGAAPMQNIGAYGVELKGVFYCLEALNLQTLHVEIFEAEQCQFGYRESFFKKEGKGKYFILSVTLKLSKHPKFNTTYGAIQTTLDELGEKELSIRAISRAVVHIRNSKLPNPAVIGNAGSFFKNPEVSAEEYIALKNEFPNIPGYYLEDGKVKVPAGWMIEQCGWKGKRIGNTGSHKDQALVLVNYGDAQGDEIYALALEIQKSVQEKFDITISPEVNVI